MNSTISSHINRIEDAYETMENDIALLRLSARWHPSEQLSEERRHARRSKIVTQLRVVEEKLGMALALVRGLRASLQDL